MDNWLVCKKIINLEFSSVNIVGETGRKSRQAKRFVGKYYYRARRANICRGGS